MFLLLFLFQVINTFRKISYLIKEISVLMKYILINENDSNLIDLLDLLLKLLTKSKDVIEYRKNIITNETIKIVPILFFKLESISSNTYKILSFNNIQNPKDFILSMIIDIFKYLYSYDTIVQVENPKFEAKNSNISKNMINNIKIISFNISIERNLALNLSIINNLLENDLDEKTFQSLFDFCVVSVHSKNNLDEILFEILFQRLNYMKENIIKTFMNSLINESSNEYFLSRICDLPYFFLYFNNWLSHIFQISIQYKKIKFIINFYRKNRNSYEFDQ